MSRRRFRSGESQAMAKWGVKGRSGKVFFAGTVWCMVTVVLR